MIKAEVIYNKIDEIRDRIAHLKAQIKTEETRLEDLESLVGVGRASRGAAEKGRRGRKSKVVEATTAGVGRGAPGRKRGKRDNSRIALAHEYLTKLGREAHVKEIADAIGVPDDAKVRLSLSSTLFGYAKRGKLFAKGDGNVYSAIPADEDAPRPASRSKGKRGKAGRSRRKASQQAE